MRAPDKHTRTKQDPITGSVWITLALLCGLPIAALFFRTGEMTRNSAYAIYLIGSLVTFFVYRHDKRAAESGRWRTPETSLHLLELFGGWPGAFLGQHRYRHKTSKASFQFSYWCIVAMHQFVALDALLHWRFSLKFWKSIQPALT